MTMAAVVMTTVVASCGGNSGNTTVGTSDSDTTATPMSMTAKDDDQLVAANIARFDTLDFNIFNKRDWERFHENHADDVIVHFPDGHSTKGLKKHVEDMEAMFVYAPDTRITSHDIKIGQGNITAVTGVMEGTFTEPMPDGKGGFIKPTGKKFKIPMSTFSIWNDDGKMSEEFLYWDNKAYMTQMGLGQ